MRINVGNPEAIRFKAIAQVIDAMASRHAMLDHFRVRHRKLHSLRHTYASLMIEQKGIELHFLQQQLGHHSPAFTLSVYGYLIPRDRRSEVAFLTNWFPLSTKRHPIGTLKLSRRTTK